ncbi:MAG: GHKL domain-containing protein [Deltaproteobacteria bacterium]|nr:GHKL domain-containing protein [Deltaproteobacteria bacterium]
MSKRSALRDALTTSNTPEKPARLSSNITELRQKLLKLALRETRSADFLSTSLQMVSEAFSSTVLFVDEEDAVGHSRAESFLVSAQDRAIGSLLIDRSVRQQLNASVADVQEIADIIGISMLSLQQNEALAALETESEEMLQYAPDLIFVLGVDGVIGMANQKANELMRPQGMGLKGTHISAVFDTMTMADLLAREQSGGKFEVELVGPAGRRLVSFSASKVTQESGEMQLLMVGRDITTERQAELALRRSERATLMAQTIDYLLHEVNNPLGALLSSISTVMRKSERLRKQLQSEEGSESAGGAGTFKSDIQNLLSLQQNILQSARKSGLRIHDAMKILRSANHKRTLGDAKRVDPAFELGLAISALEQEHRHIQVVKNLSPLPTIDAPPLHLAEIFGALLKNAAESVQSMPPGSRQIVVSGGVQAERLVISIEDNGYGIPSDIREKVFMPFFTTKPLGKSIGLGLSMALDMAKRVGGGIELDRSERLGGACVRIFFSIR